MATHKSDMEVSHAYSVFLKQICLLSTNKILLLLPILFTRIVVSVMIFLYREMTLDLSGQGLNICFNDHKVVVNYRAF